MKKKICFIVSSPMTVKSFLCNHIKELSKYYDVYLVSNIVKEDNYFLSLPLSEIKCIPIKREVSLLQDIKALLLLINYLKRHKFDAIHSITPKAGLISMLAGKFAKIKIRIHIFTGQVWHTKTGLIKLFLKFMDKCIVWCSTTILIDGNSQRDFLIKNKIVKEKKSIVLGRGSISGVDTNKFILDDQLSNDIRKELNINPTTIIFMFLGRLKIDKGVLDLVDAFLQLKKKHNNIYLLLVGIDEESIERKIRYKHDDRIDSINFYGPTNFPEKILQVCDVFCLPSYREGFGTSILEASLLKKAVICSDTYGLRDTVIENETGLIHKIMDVKSLIYQMEKLIENKELRISLGERGEQYVLNNFTSQILTNEWVKFYKAQLESV